MMDYNLYNRVLDNSASDEDVVEGVNSKYDCLLVFSLCRLIERDIYSNKILERLKEISKRIKNSKVVGAWQVGHFALAALCLSSSKEYKKTYDDIYSKLNDDDKFLIDFFLEKQAYKML